MNTSEIVEKLKEMSDEEYRFVNYRPWKGDLYGSSDSMHRE